jgi:hypothetical protein
MRKHPYLLGCLVLLLSLLLLAREPASVLGVTYYIVNSGADPGDIPLCTEAECTLREAITAADSDAGSSNIAFDIPASDPGYNSSTGVWTIYLAGDLPTFTDDGTAIMGSTQTDNQGDTNPYGPEIAVNGASAYECFLVGSANNTLEGLAINQCTYGIRINGILPGVHHNNIVGNYIGLDAQGIAASGNTMDGIYIHNSGDNTVGGDTGDARNIISGNLMKGVVIHGDGADRNLIKGNYIGTDASGRGDVGNADYGVGISGGAQDNQIGPDNIIAYNLHGVLIGQSETIYNTVTQNSIHSNVGMGIWLSLGGNGGILPPEITMASCSSAIGAAPEGHTIELFSDYDGEGRQFHGSAQATKWNLWMVSLPSGLFSYPNLTATATDTAGNTSEFSDPFPNGCLFRYLPLTMKGY